MRSVLGHRLIPALALGLFLVASSGSLATANETSIDPEAPVCASQQPESSFDGACGDGATLIEPDPSVIDGHPSAWDHVVVGADGRTLTVYFWMGVQDCNGLHSVDVTATESGIDLTLFTGIPEGAGDLMCIELAQLYKTIVTLDEPLIGGAA